MAVLTQTEIGLIAQDRAGCNVTTDAPISAAELQRFVNDAYADVWQIAGGRNKMVSSTTAWQSANSGVGAVFGLLTDVEEVLHLWGETSDGLSLSCTTNQTTTVTSAAAFGSVTVGMLVTGTGIPTNTMVTAKATASSLTISKAATDSTTTARSFSPTIMTNELQRVDLAYVEHLRGTSGAGHGTYYVPKLYAVTRLSSTTPAEVNLLRLDYWPGVTGFYFPMQYVPQFTPLDGSGVTTPDLNDLESRDVALLTAARIAPLLGRAELVPSILADVSQRTAEALERKMSALLEGKQDK